MSFSLTQMILISAAYLLVLFGVAWISERGLIPRSIIRHPLTYTLSLGVYASAWAFYGSVGLAYQYGYGFLACYLGVSGAFLLATVLLYPILKITRTYQLVAGRLAGVSLSQHVGRRAHHHLHVDRCAAPAGPADPGGGRLDQHPHRRAGQGSGSLAFCVLIILFTIFFGSRHIATRENTKAWCSPSPSNR